MDEMNITSAQYCLDPITGINYGIIVIIDGVEGGVPLVTGNRHYDEIMRQVEAGTLVIAEAD